MKVNLLILLSIFCSMVGFTQDQPTKKGNFDISLIGTMSFGNGERIILINNVNYKFQNSSKKIEFISNNRYVYGTVSRKKIVLENDFRTSNYLILLADKKWNLVIGFHYQNLLIKKINSLYKPMLGVQHKLVNTNTFVLTPCALIGYGWQTYDGNIFANFDNKGSKSINGMNINLGSQAIAKLFNNKLTLSMFTIYQLGIEEGKHQRLWFDVNVIVPLYKGLYFRASINNYFENIVLKGTRKHDTNIGYGLGFKF